jgi:hypothetical protein
LAPFLDQFQRCAPHDIERILGGHGYGSSWDLSQERKWIHGQTIDRGTPILTPVATVQIRIDNDGQLSGCLRVALFYELDGVVGWHGWRFETADYVGDRPPHPYPHAQHMEEWTKGSRIAAGNEPDSEALTVEQRLPFNEQRPAFPLRGGRSITGLAVVMLATLYGAPDVKDWLLLLSRDRAVSEEARSDINAILY